MGWERKMERAWNEKREFKGWFKQTESESICSNSSLSPCPLFCESLRQKLIGRLAASAPPAASYCELLHGRASSDPAGHLSFCQHKGFFSSLFYFAKSTFLKQIQQKPEIWHIQCAKCCIFCVSKSLTYLFWLDNNRRQTSPFSKYMMK